MVHRIAPEAESDLDGIWQYIATSSQSFEVADRFIDVITEHFLVLTRYPHLGRPRDEELRPRMRSFAASGYLILYRIEQESEQQVVLILRVISGSRDYKKIFSRTNNL